MCRVGMDYFDEKTNFSRKNANKELVAVGIYNTFLASLYEYGTYLKRDKDPAFVYMMLFMTQFNQTDLYKCMLGDKEGQKAIDELTQNGKAIDNNDDEAIAAIARGLTNMIFSKS